MKQSLLTPPLAKGEIGGFEFFKKDISKQFSEINRYINRERNNWHISCTKKILT